MLDNKRTAVIDLGTNTFELLIAESVETGFTILHQERVGVFIGRGGIDKGFITEEAQIRMFSALQHLKEVILKFNVAAERVFGVATSAFRNAQNGKMLVAEILEKIGIPIEIISGEKEAEYIFQGVKAAITLQESPALVMDIGGGSVEFIIGNQRKIFWKRSFEIGAQRLKNMFMPNDPITLLNTQKLEIFLESQLVELSQLIFNYSPKFLIGSAGTFDTLAEMSFRRSHPKLDMISASELNAYEVSADDFYYFYYQLTTLNRAERLQIPGMIEIRADMIVVSVCLLKFVLEKCELDTIHCSSYALKEGYLQHKI
jgi:exopolyphosphatase / guanosine-5'-triphosphate,3'-diphosphate pyrophosphatase